MENLDPVRFTAVGETTPDFDGNGVTRLEDFYLFADAFGSDDARYDLDGSGSVSYGDFFIFVDYFGKPARGQSDSPGAGPDRVAR